MAGPPHLGNALRRRELEPSFAVSLSAALLRAQGDVSQVGIWNLTVVVLGIYRGPVAQDSVLFEIVPDRPVMTSDGIIVSSARCSFRSEPTKKL